MRASSRGSNWWRWAAALGIAAVAFSGCTDEMPSEIDRAGGLRLELSAKSLGSHFLQTGSCVSILDQIILSVDDEERGQTDIDPEQSVFTFENVAVEENQEVAVVVLSNNGTELFSASETYAGGSVVDLTLAAVNAVLEVCPDTLRLTNLDEEGSFTIHNRGNSPLLWNVEPIDDTAPIALRATEGQVEAGDSLLLIVQRTATVEQIVPLTITSTEGSVVVQVNVGAPDLIVESMEAGEPFVVDTDEGSNVIVPLDVTVANVGNSPAQIFKVSVSYINPEGNEFTVPYTVAGEESIFYPFTDEPLLPDETVTFSGEVVFVNASNVVVTIRATADSCSGDEFMPGYCRVEEISEENNTMLVESVVLP